jgi:ACS family hexuronate transporter-like MFS transporter
MITKYRWRIVALLFFATTINYVDRQVIGILKPYIADDLGWTETGYGYIVAAFQVAYAVGLVVTGGFLDRVGTRLGYSVAIVLWSIAGMAHAAARGVWSFAAARFGLGLGESANFPAAVKATAEWFPKKDRALATGWFNSGASIGAVLAPVIVWGSYARFGWQGAFIITGALGFIWLIFWRISYQLPEKHSKVSPEELKYIRSDEEEQHDKVAWKSILPHRQTIAIVLSRFVTDWVWWFYLFWTPDFLNKQYGINIRELVLPLIAIYGAASFGGIAGGWLSSNFIRRGKSIDYARKTSILICALCVVPVMFTARVPNLWLAVMLISMAAASHQGWASNIFTVVSDIYPRGAVASMVGLSGFGGAIGGALAASFVGFVLDLTGSYMLIFGIAGTAYLLAWGILKLMIRRIEPIGNLE